jgi:chemotaxis protein MotB
MNKQFNIFLMLALLILCFTVSGCAVGFYKGLPSDKAKIEELKDELIRLREARSILESRLKSEIDSNQIALTMDDRGIIITFVAEVLFDSGKADLKPDGKDMLKKIALVIRQEVADNEIGIEGHTDNVPIEHSGWKSNWELSTARATSVLHYLISDCGLIPDRLSATGYGQYRPVESNNTKEGRQANRRVEIIIRPIPDTKVAYSPADKDDRDYIK